MSPDLSASLVPCLRGGRTLPVGLLLLHATVLLVDEQLAGRPAPRQPLAARHRFVLGLVHAGGPACPPGLDPPPPGWAGSPGGRRPLASRLPRAAAASLVLCTLVARLVPSAWTFQPPAGWALT